VRKKTLEHICTLVGAVVLMFFRIVNRTVWLLVALKTLEDQPTFASIPSFIAVLIILLCFRGWKSTFA
jgi:hypothetical protein